MLSTFGAAAVAAAACGLATSGTGEDVGEHPDSSTPPDATVGDEVTVGDDAGVIVDGSKVDSASSDASDDADANLPLFLCDDAGTTSCSTCAGRPTACSATGACVAECITDCPAAPIACFRCFGAGATVTGTCEAENDAGYCMNGAYAPGEACPCVTHDAAVCPGEYQICMDAGLGFSCHSCGEQGTNGKACKGGTGAGNCDTGGGAGRLTCH